MKNILTTVATATLLSGLALSSAAASSVLCFDGNTSITKKDNNISIDLKGKGVDDVNLTLVPAAVYQGASFKLKFENGGLSENKTHLLCVGDTKVGGLQEPGDVTDHVMTAPTFSFIDNDSVAALIQKDSNITFETTSDCSTDGNASEGLDIVGLAGKPCQTITAKIVDGKSTQGQDIPSINTNAATFGTTKTFIKVSCTPPECFVTGDKLKFTNAAAAPGVNVALTSSTKAIPNHTVLTTADCPECGEKAPVINCETTIVIENNNTFGIKGLDLVANFNNGEKVDNAAFKPVIDVDVNGSTKPGYTLGSKFSASGLTIGSNEQGKIKLTLTPNNTDMIATGDIVAKITGLDSNITGAAANDIVPTFTNKTLANIKIGAKTQFTVPYMNGNTGNFVKISTRSDSETSVSAVIKDSKGTSCPVDLTPIVAKGSTYVFAGTAPAGAEYQNLIPEGKCTDLTDKKYSVVFTTNAAVDAISYMSVGKGAQRYVNVY